MSINQLMKDLKKDLRTFYRNKNIKKRLERIMNLFDPEEENQEIPENLVYLIDSLNDIGEVIQLCPSKEKCNCSEIKNAVIPFKKFFKKKPKDEISEEEIELIKQELREEKNQ